MNVQGIYITISVLCVPLQSLKYLKNRYAHIDNWMYAPVIGAFNDQKIVIFENSSTNENTFDDIYKIILDGIFSHMCYVVSTE